jgi:hypothetical protein
VVPSSRRTQSEGETLELLLTTHFPNSGVTQELAAPAAALLARRPGWRLATRVVTYRRVEWAIDSFAPYKSLGVDGIFPALLQQARRLSSHTWSEYFVPAWLCSSHVATGQGGV